MKTYSKFAPNVFLAKSSDIHNSGDTITLTTRYGKENECIVHNLVYSKDGFNYYSITRLDGFNFQEWAKRKAERIAGYSATAEKKAGEYYEKSNKDRDFLSLAEPIKIGHHSEKRHRKVIKECWDNTSKWIESLRKSESYQSRIEYWSDKSVEICISMPVSIEFYEIKLSEAMKYHELMKKTPKRERPHSYSLTYAKNNVNKLTKKFELSKQLWG